MKRPKRVLIYSIVLWLIALMNGLGCITSWQSESEIINALRPIRIPLLIFGACALGFAGFALLKRISWTRFLVVLSLTLHIIYMIVYNWQVLHKDGEPMGLEWMGFMILIIMALGMFIPVMIIPFTPKFSRYLRSQRDDSHAKQV
jgi:hypothetical protein